MLSTRRSASLIRSTATTTTPQAKSNTAATPSATINLSRANPARGHCRRMTPSLWHRAMRDPTTTAAYAVGASISSRNHDAARGPSSQETRTYPNSACVLPPIQIQKGPNQCLRVETRSDPQGHAQTNRVLVEVRPREADRAALKQCAPPLRL